MTCKMVESEIDFQNILKEIFPIKKKLIISKDKGLLNDSNKRLNNYMFKRSTRHPVDIL